MNLKTREIDNPKFTFEGVPATDQNGYFKSQKINVQYADDATPDTALNYVMTTRNGKSNIKVTKKCETIQETNTPNVASCSDIENGGTNDLVANQWYEIPKDANLSIHMMYKQLKQPP